MKRFPSIRKNGDFQKVYRKGTSRGGRLLVMHVLPRTDGGTDTRIGISVSRKVGNSVVRHRVTRRIREIFRLHKEETGSGFDIVVVVRPAAAESDFRSLESAYVRLCGLHNIRKESK